MAVAHAALNVAGKILLSVASPALPNRTCLIVTLPSAKNRPVASQAVDRISIDVTETVATGKWTGIERVVRRLSTELQNAENTPIIRLVVAIKGQFYELNAEGAKQLTRPNQSLGRGERSRITRMLGSLLSYTPTLLLAVQSAQKDRHFGTVLKPLVKAHPAEFVSGDVVLLLDSYWAGTTAVRAAHVARRAGAAIVSTIYDLIPITHPFYMPRTLTRTFPRRVMQALQISDGAIAISRYSADELRNWLGRNLPTLPIEPFHLGNDPTTSTNKQEKAFQRHYAMIGTIEPRKRHDLVLDAFEKRWAQNAQCQLTIVGRIGWASPKTQSRLAALKAQGRIELIHDANDAQLASILAETDAVIMASKIEGFGLPIVEALALDIPVIASDIAIFREVGGEAIIPFDPDSSDALVAAMERLEAEPIAWRARAHDHTWPSWSVAAAQLVTVLETMLRGSTPTSSLLD